MEVAHSPAFNGSVQRWITADSGCDCFFIPSDACDNRHFLSCAPTNIKLVTDRYRSEMIRYTGASVKTGISQSGKLTRNVFGDQPTSNLVRYGNMAYFGLTKYTFRDNTLVMAILLVKLIRTLRGGSQPHLMQANDGNLYVVKFQDNPQGTRVLVNEMLAAKLASMMGLSVPKTVVVELPLKLSEELYFETPNGRQPIRPGLHLGSRLVITALKGRSYDFMPQSFRHLVRNPEDLIGIQLFDLWTCNRDSRQLVFWKHSRDKKYTVTFIDNGHCFGGPEWSFAPMVFPEGATSPDTAEAWQRWADRIATFPIRRFESDETGLIPKEWCGGVKQLAVMFEELRTRQAMIAATIRNSVKRFGSCGLDICKVEKLPEQFLNTMSLARLSTAVAHVM